MTLGLTQPVTEMSTRNISWVGGKSGRCNNIHVPIVLKSGSFSLLEPLGPVQACNGIALHFYTCNYTHRDKSIVMNFNQEYVNIVLVITFVLLHLKLTLYIFETVHGKLMLVY